MATDSSVAADVDDVVEAPEAALRPLLAVVHGQPTSDAATLTQPT
ncbi:hypothetical protein [Mycobacteroides abscessus]|nr:hypothetical protein [Mycobacteroides abscessus]